MVYNLIIIDTAFRVATQQSQPSTYPSTMVTDSVAIILLSAFIFCLTAAGVIHGESGISCTFKDRELLLSHPMQPSPEVLKQKGRRAAEQLDTLSNWFSPVRKYVEIVRQDHPVRPTLGIAMGFEFDETNGDYPYTPAFAVMQLKDFGWGGVEFSRRDTLNYTGISNTISDDLHIEISDYRNDTIFGHFSGILISGGGSMASLEKGSFAVKVYRVE